MKTKNKIKKEEKQMATNWSLFEGAKAILGGDNAAIAELGKRFPQTTVAIASMGNNEGAMKIFGALPVHVTMRKVESVLKGEIVDSDEDSDDTEDEAPKAKSTRGRKPKAAKSDDDKKAAAKARRDARKAAKKAEEEVDEPDVDEETGEVDYSAMTAVELFKECKKRGLAAKPKQKAADYIKLLKADDEGGEEVEEDTDAEDDGWDDEEEEAPKKTTKKASKKAAKADEDEDDDWDI